MSTRQPIGSVVAAVDGSARSNRGLRLAAEIASGLGASLRVVHVVRMREVPVLIAEAESDREVEEGRVVLAAAVRIAKELGVTAEPILLHGGAADQIVRYLRGHPADLLVLGTRGLRGAKGVLLGSVSQAVSRRVRIRTVLVP